MESEDRLEIREGFKSLATELKEFRKDARETVPKEVVITIVNTLCRLLLILMLWFTGVQPNLENIKQYGAAVAAATSTLVSNAYARARE